MKQNIFLELLKNLKTNHQLKRKFKIFIGVGLAGFLMVGTLSVLAGITAVKQVARLGENPQIQEHVMALKGEIENIPVLAKVGCWNKVQGLMNVEVWLEKPIADNLNSLKLACFANNPSK